MDGIGNTTSPLKSDLVALGFHPKDPLVTAFIFRAPSCQILSIMAMQRRPHRSVIGSLVKIRYDYFDFTRAIAKAKYLSPTPSTLSFPSIFTFSNPSHSLCLCGFQSLSRTHPPCHSVDLCLAITRTPILPNTSCPIPPPTDSLPRASTKLSLTNPTFAPPRPAPRNCKQSNMFPH